MSLCLWRVPVSLCCKTKTKQKTENVPNIFLYRTTFIGHLRDHIALQRHRYRTDISICDDLQVVTGILCCFSVCTSMIRFFGRLLLSTLSFSSYSLVGVVGRALSDFFPTLALQFEIQSFPACIHWNRATKTKHWKTNK